MKTLLKLSICFLVFMALAGCVTRKELVDGLVQLQVMDNICVSNVDYTITQPTKPGTSDGKIEFRAVLNNPSAEDGHGTVRLVMGVDASGLSLSSGVQSITANSVQPYFETPSGALFPAHQSTPYISPVLISMAYSPGATYKIEIRKFIAPQLDSDETSCHNFKITKQL